MENAPSSVLSPAQIGSFREQGYLVLRKMVAPADCARMQSVALDHVQRAVAPLEYEAEVGYAGAPASLDSLGGRTARRLRDAYQRDDSYRNWARAPQLVGMLQQLLGQPVCITLAHHNCVMTKHPHFGTATGWHRDIRYWSFEKPDLISVWLALGDENEQNGGLLFIPGSHRLTIRPEQMDELDFLRPERPDNQALFAQGKPLTLAAGDVALFHSGLFHAGGRNNTEQLKTSVVFAYHGADNAPIAGTRSAASPDLRLS
jgi:phytanoyl-CoA hydroxylase